MHRCITCLHTVITGSSCTSLLILVQSMPTETSTRALACVEVSEVRLMQGYAAVKKQGQKGTCSHMLLTDLSAASPPLGGKM